MKMWEHYNFYHDHTPNVTTINQVGKLGDGWETTIHYPLPLVIPHPEWA